MSTATSDLATLSNANGVFTMLALDHRGSLQTIMESGGRGRSAGDDQLRDFKRIAIQELAPLASACLLDLDYGLGANGSSPLPPGTGLIVAAQEPDRKNGTTINSTRFDARVTRELVESSGAVALKILVNWEPGGDRARTVAFVAEFIELARQCGVLSLVEGITWPSPGWASDDERDDAIIECATEICGYRPDIYKAEVSGYRTGDVSRVPARSRQLTESISCPWVVLSHGVPSVDFPTMVELCCGGGASGFLAGQAVWADIARDALMSSDTSGLFRDRGARHFLDLCASAERGFQRSHAR